MRHFRHRRECPLITSLAAVQSDSGAPVEVGLGQRGPVLDGLDRWKSPVRSWWRNLRERKNGERYWRDRDLQRLYVHDELRGTVQRPRNP